MSKWTDARNWIKDISCECDENVRFFNECNDLNCPYKKRFQNILEALDIAERLEKAEADVYGQYCECCVTVGICRDKAEICAEASYWLDGYDTAIEDMKGETDD